MTMGHWFRSGDDETQNKGAYPSILLIKILLHATDIKKLSI